jgi:FkbM family methyltransferase
MRAQDIFIVREILGEDPYQVLGIKEAGFPRCILDLGAHIGLATLQFRAAFPDALIHCYEPDPDNLRPLRFNTAGLPGVVVHGQAVGGLRGEQPFYVRPARHAGSSLHGILNHPGVDRPDTREIRVEVRPLDDCLREAGLPVDVVKFDIEAAEFEAFSGSTLARASDGSSES